MSVQYRPELGSISLIPCYPTDLNDSGDNSQGLSGGFGVMKFRSQGSPISPLSPQELSLVSDAVYCGGSYNSPTFTSPSMSRSVSRSVGRSSMSSGRRDDGGYLQIPCVQQHQNEGSCYDGDLMVQNHVGYGNQMQMQMQMGSSYGGGGAGVGVVQLSQEQVADTCLTVNQRSQTVAQMLQELESALLDDDDTAFSGSMCEGRGSVVDPNLAFDIDDILYRSSPSSDNNVEGCECSSGGVVQYPTSNNARQAVVDVAVAQALAAAPAKDANAMQELVPNKAFFGRNKLEQMLVQCAEAVSNHQLDLAHDLMAQLNQSVSIYGDPTQRLAAYMVEGLVARVASSGRRFYDVLKCKQPPNLDMLSAMQILYEVCPYFKFGYMAANGAIAEAFKDEKRVHIIDFEITQGAQWFTLIQALAARPGGPPHVRLTGIDDPLSQMSSNRLDKLGKTLSHLAKSVGVPFEFHGIPKNMTDVEVWMLELREDEALACNFALELHHVPDESVCVSNPRDRLLRMVKSLNPKVVTMVEQELNTNTAPFLPRFMEALSYYSAIFESLDVTLPRESKDRVNVEQQCLARDIVNIIACEGLERVERHEVIWKWRARMTMAGFKSYPLSSYVNTTIKTLLHSYCDKYRLKEEGGALYLGWLNRALITASAWH